MNFLWLLQKGGGYHLDLFILAFLTTLNSIFGLPWFVAATVLSINHVNSLKLESECAAPGEKPQFLGVRWVIPTSYSLKRTTLFLIGNIWVHFQDVLSRTTIRFCYSEWMYPCMCMYWRMDEVEDKYYIYVLDLVAHFYLKCFFNLLCITYLSLGHGQCDNSSFKFSQKSIHQSVSSKDEYVLGELCTDYSSLDSHQDPHIYSCQSVLSHMSWRFYNIMKHLYMVVSN